MLFRRRFLGTFVLSFGKIQHKIGYPAMVRRRDRETLVLNMEYKEGWDSVMRSSVGGMVLGSLRKLPRRLVDPQERAWVERNVERSERGRGVQTKALNPEFSGFSLHLLCIYERLYLVCSGIFPFHNLGPGCFRFRFGLCCCMAALAVISLGAAGCALMRRSTVWRNLELR